MVRGEMNKKGECSYLFSNKKGSGIFGMGFGMIFSIILIVFFVIVAFIAINAFLDTQRCAQIGLFIEDLQGEVDKTWNSQKSDFEFKSRLPNKIKYACFLDLDKDITAVGTVGNIGRDLGVYKGYIANFFLYPTEPACNMVFHEIDHIDLDKIISEKKNPYCISVDDGVIKIPIKKDFNEKLVSIG